jgi:protocatechuate 3,4-dioxygenase alpha subunit
MSELIATGSQTVGPFFHFGLTADGATNAVALPPDRPRLALTVRVTDGTGEPVADAVVEIWYAADPAEREIRCLFARLPTTADGSCRFEIVRPAGDAPGAHARAPHVNVCLFARGLLRHLHTRIYFDADPQLGTDPVLALVPEDRRSTLLARLDAGSDDRWAFDLRLQGAGETVFFDV